VKTIADTLTRATDQQAHPAKADSTLARLRSSLIPALIAVLCLTAAGWGYPSLPTDPVPGSTRTVKLPNGATMKFVWIDPGTSAAPRQRAAVSHGYYLGQSAVTAGQWQAVMGTIPWAAQENHQGSTRNPALRVSWDEVQAFVEALNQAAGEMIYRLPTAAEWVYACKAGADDRWSGDEGSSLGQYAWDGRVTAQPVGLRQPNAWGLFDMHGSVTEWVQNGFGCRGGETSMTRRARQDGRICSEAQFAPATVTASASLDDRGVALGARLVMVR
jgi:formylglycine-generating enzyme required for sulfatase activity